LKTLKAKLFLSVGAVLLLVGVLNNFLAETWIKRGLTRNSISLNGYVEGIQEKIRKFTSFVLTLNVVRQATDLERVAYMFASEKIDTSEEDSLWKEAERIILEDPRIAFVEIEGAETVGIAPEDAPLHPFSIVDEWVKVEGEEELFVAVPVEESEGVYLLFSREDAKVPEDRNVPSPSRFETVRMETLAYGTEDEAKELFKALLSIQNGWIYKTDLIKNLVPWQTKRGARPVGAIKVAKQGDGGCLLSKEVFYRPSALKEDFVKDGTQRVFLKVRQNLGKTDLNVDRSWISDQGVLVRIGFSVLEAFKQAAMLGNKTILLNAPGVSLGVTPNGSVFDYSSEGYSFENQKKSSVVHKNKKYFSYSIDFSLFSASVLTPAEEASVIPSFLRSLGEDIIFNVSVSLTGAALISFIIALALLRNISTKITNPIATLCKAAERLGTGTYEGVVLPAIGNRRDEVAKLTHSFAGMVSALQDRDKIRGVLHKVVSKEISEKILKGNLDFKGEERVLTLLFSDIRGFTKMSEGLPPQVLIRMLNEYMTRMCSVIDATHGVVDKFVGDEIMTLYGAPLPMERHGARAVEAALHMMEDLYSWNEERKKEGLPIFEIGIGIHTGLVYTGNMGAENRLNYTAIGSNVNLASRVCSVAGPMQILITEKTYSDPGVRERFLFRTLDPVPLKGIEMPVQLYEVTGFVSS